MKRLALIAVFVFFAADFALLYGAQVSLDKGRDLHKRVEELSVIPRGEYMKRASLGYDTLVADFIWLKTIQVMGSKTLPPEYADWIYHALDVLTDLDPKFEYAYRAGGIFLSAVTKSYDKSNDILKKGFYNNPDVWELPFYIGFNYFFRLDDYKHAAYYMGRAAELPGRPSFIPLLATRLYAESGDPRFALELIDRIYESASDERVRAELRARMDELIVEINLDVLQRAVGEYKAKYGKYPPGVGELAASGISRYPPKDPLGGQYLINPLTGEVTNTAMKRRLRVFKPGDKR